MTATKIINDIYDSVGVDLTHAGWDRYIAETAADVEAVRVCVDVLDAYQIPENGRWVIRIR
jgi:hypothetical protein